MLTRSLELQQFAQCTGPGLVEGGPQRALYRFQVGAAGTTAFGEDAA
jgi:hypothetical protein